MAAHALSPPRGAKKSAPIKTIDAAKLRASLAAAQARLERMEKGKESRAGLEAILKGLSKPDFVRVRRSDGATQVAGNAQWERMILDLQNPDGGTRTGPIRRVDVTEARRAVAQRKLALEDWMTPRGKGFYQAAQVQKIVRDLENADRIRTGPTAWQQWWADFKAAFSNLMNRLGKSIFGTGNTPTPGTSKIDPRWVKFFFYSTVLSLLGVIGWLMWRHLGGRFGRDGARRDVRFVGGDDAELLVLPQSELRTRAQKFADEGNFREALRHRFIALLLYLDDRGVWRYDARRTNWEHIGALRRRMSTHVGAQGLIDPLSSLTRRFDRVRYGNAQASRDDWSLFDRDAATLETTANQGATPASTTPSATATATGARS